MATLEPGSYPSFDKNMATVVSVVTVLAACVASLYPRYQRGRILAFCVTLAVGASLVVLAGFLSAGVPSCDGEKPTCFSKALGSRIPLDLCPTRLPCECHNDRMCGNGNQCTEEGLCINKLSGKRDIISTVSPFRVRSIHAIAVVPVLLLAIVGGWGIGRTFLYSPKTPKLALLSFLSLSAVLVMSIATIHFTGRPDQKYAPISDLDRFPDISFADGARTISFPTAHAACPTVQDTKAALVATAGDNQVGHLEVGWLTTSPDGTRNAVFKLGGAYRRYLVVRYPPDGGSPDTMIADNWSVDPSFVVCK